MESRYRYGPSAGDHRHRSWHLLDQGLFYRQPLAKKPASTLTQHRVGRRAQRRQHRNVGTGKAVKVFSGIVAPIGSHRGIGDQAPANQGLDARG
jgi:hypothetical protein